MGSVKLTSTESEWEMWKGKWEELQGLSLDLVSAPSSARGRQRLQQRLCHQHGRMGQFGGSDPRTFEKRQHPGNYVFHYRRATRKTKSCSSGPGAHPSCSGGRGRSSGGTTSSLCYVLRHGGVYQQLPNPVAGIVKQILEVDGLEETHLMNFLGRLFQLADFPGMVDATVLQLVYPYCRGADGRADSASCTREAHWTNSIGRCWTPLLPVD